MTYICICCTTTFCMYIKSVKGLEKAKGSTVGSCSAGMPLNLGLTVKQLSNFEILYDEQCTNLKLTGFAKAKAQVAKGLRKPSKAPYKNQCCESFRESRISYIYIISSENLSSRKKMRKPPVTRHLPQKPKRRSRKLCENPAKAKHYYTEK